jgi:hypothetical protein
MHLMLFLMNCILKSKMNLQFGQKLQLKIFIGNHRLPLSARQLPHITVIKTFLELTELVIALDANDLDSQIKGITCPESSRQTDDTGEVSVTGNLFLSGGGGPDGVSFANVANNKRPARVYMRGVGNANIVGVNPASPLKGALTAIYIDKSSPTDLVNLSGVITFIDRFVRIEGTIVAGTSTVRIDTRQYHAPFWI